VDDEALSHRHEGPAAEPVRPRQPGGAESDAEVVAVPARFEPELYERLIDRLRHAAQYAEAARGIAEELRSTIETEDSEVLAMTAEAIGDRERVLDQLRHAQQYADAAALAVQDALELLDEARGA
jgi:hypothetical protein